MTEAGTVRAALLLARETAVAAEAAALSVTAQEEEPAAATVVGAQISEERETATGVAVTVPPEAVIVSAAPLAVALIGLVIPTVALVNADVVVIETTAATPFAIVLALSP